MENVCISDWKRFVQNGPGAIRIQLVAERAEEPVGAVAAREVGFGVGCRETGNDFAGVNANAGQIPPDAIRGIEGYSQATILARAQCIRGERA